MKILIIGGTGTISSEVVSLLCRRGDEVTLINRGTHADSTPLNAEVIRADIQDKAAVSAALGKRRFDVVAGFIVFKREQAQRDYELFADRCGQYVFISSASAYQKPPTGHIITEQTPLANPFWQYSRDKIACEEYFFERYRKDGFPVTVVRPSHTYGVRSVPVMLHGNRGSWQVIRRIQEEKPVLIAGDGESLWTITHASDFAPLFAAVLGRESAIGEAYQITSDEAMSWNRIYRSIADALGKPLVAAYRTSRDIIARGRKYGYDFEGPLLGDKANSVLFDNRKIKALAPDYTMKTPFCKGVRMALEYILSHPACQTNDEDFDRFCDDMCRA